MAPKSGQPPPISTLHRRLIDFDPDLCSGPVVGQFIEVAGSETLPMHQHRRGQLLTSSRGSVTCETVDGFWPVLPDRGLWIPGDRPHRSIVSTQGTVIIVYLDGDQAGLPPTACILKLTALVREMVVHVAHAKPDYESSSLTGRVASILFDHMRDMEVEKIYIPMPDHPGLRRIAEAILADPSSRKTLPEWASFSIMSERSLSRLIHRETAMSFGQWRQQFLLAYAMRELRSGTPIRAVSDALGYDSVSAFATMFKKSVGTPPGRYAKGDGGG